MCLLASNWLMAEAAWHVSGTGLAHNRCSPLFPLLMFVSLPLVFLVHVENICIGSLSVSFFPSPLLFFVPFFLFLSQREKEETVVKEEEVSGPEEKGSVFLEASCRGLPKHIFIMKSQHGMGRPCAAAGLICSKHVQIGRPTQTIKVEWRFCSVRRFCLTKGMRTPSKEQTDHQEMRDNTPPWFKAIPDILLVFVRQFYISVLHSELPLWQGHTMFTLQEQFCSYFCSLS